MEIALGIVIFVLVCVVYIQWRSTRSLLVTQQGLIIVMEVLKGATIYEGKEFSREQEEKHKEPSG